MSKPSWEESIKKDSDLRDQYRKAAHDKLQNHAVRVDYRAWVMPVDGGAWVECWAWVTDEEATETRSVGGATA